jgi:hypothetical protein
MKRALIILGFFCLCGLIQYFFTKTKFLKFRSSQQFASICIGLGFILLCILSFYWIRERQQQFLKDADDTITRQQSILEYNIKKQK